jgi:hypothetical protein
MTSQGSFDEVNSLIEFDVSHSGESAGATPSHFLPWVLAACTACYFLSCLGLIGASSGNRSILGLNGCLITASMITFGCTMFTVLAFDETIMPVLVRQTKEFCGPDLYPNWDDALGCTDPNTASTAKCGAECQQRLQFIKSVGGGTSQGGCSFLDTICKRATYALVKTDGQTGECWVGSDQNVRPPQLSSDKVADETQCSRLCDADIQCSAYTWNTGAGTTCNVYTKRTSLRFQETDWTVPGLNAGESEGKDVTPVDGIKVNSYKTCSRKGRPQVIEDASQYAKILALSCGVLLVFATYTLVVNMMWVYTLNTGHKGKKGFDAIQKRLCCPCLTKALPSGRKFQGGPTDTEEARLKGNDTDFDESE